MDNKTEKINQLSRYHTEELNKYTNLLIAIASAAIAYAIDKADGMKFELPLALIGVSIAAWATSFTFGVRHLNLHRDYIAANVSCIMKELSDLETLNALEPLERKIAFASQSQLIFLVIGALTYFTAIVVKSFSNT